MAFKPVNTFARRLVTHSVGTIKNQRSLADHFEEVAVKALVIEQLPLTALPLKALIFTIPSADLPTDQW